MELNYTKFDSVVFLSVIYFPTINNASWVELGGECQIVIRAVSKIILIFFLLAGILFVINKIARLSDNVFLLIKLTLLALQRILYK